MQSFHGHLFITAMVKGVKGQGRVKFLITSNGQTSSANMLALDKHAQLAIVTSEYDHNSFKIICQWHDIKGQD